MLIKRQDITEALKLLCKVAPKKPSIEIFRFVRIKASKGKVEIVATDTEQRLTWDGYADGDIDVCLPAFALQKFVKGPQRELRGAVEFEMVGDVCEVRYDEMEAKFRPVPVEDFPSKAPGRWKKVVVGFAPDLGYQMDYVLPVVSIDFTRPHINCVSIQGDKVIGTDGYRMHIGEMRHSGKFKGEHNVPRESAKILLEVLRHDPDVDFRRQEDKGKFVCGPWTLETKLVTADFPPYDQVVPKFSSYDVTVDPKKLSKVVKRASDIGISHAKVVANGALSFTVTSEERDEVTLVYRPEEPGCPDDEEHVVGLNLAFVLDALKGETAAKFSLGGSMDPLRIDSDNGARIAVVMPCRI